MTTLFERLHFTYLAFLLSRKLHMVSKPWLHFSDNGLNRVRIIKPCTSHFLSFVFIKLDCVFTGMQNNEAGAEDFLYFFTKDCCAVYF